MKMDPVVHFEMPGVDKKRMSAFYENAFGWKTHMLGQDMGEYVVVTTTEIDEKTGRPTIPGAINGGFYQKDPNKNDHYPSLVIGVEDAMESMKKVVEAGGKILSGPNDIPGVGLYVSFEDTEGNRVSLLQPKTMA